MLEGRKVELRVAESPRARQKGDLCAGRRSLAIRARPNGGRTHLGERRLGDAIAEPHEPLSPAAEDAHFEPGREAVDDRNADAVQPARYLIGVLIELTAGVEVGHYDLGGGHPLLVVNPDRDAAAIVGNGA